MKLSLIVTTIGLSFALSVDGCSSTSSEFSPEALAKAKAASSAVHGDNLHQDIVAIVAQRQLEDAPVSHYNVQAPLARTNAAKYLTDAFTKIGLAPVVETAALSVGDSNTISADIQGSAPGLVLLTGHYDAWFRAGADDNGSALAVLLEAARVLKDTKPKRTVRLIAFDREEEGIIGSAAYFAAHRRDDIRIVINMDCVGYARHFAGSQLAPPGLTLRDVGNFLAVLANGPAERHLARFANLSRSPESSLDVLGLLAPDDSHYVGTGAFLQSDHVSPWNDGIPSLFLTDTADFRNPNYHEPSDLPETLDYDFLASVARLTIGATAAFAESD